MLIVNGTTHIRTHAEFDPTQGFTGFEAIMEVKEKYKSFIDMPTVLHMITTNPAKALGIKDYGIKVGHTANLVLLDTESVTNAIIEMPTRLFVIKNGRVTVKTEKVVTVYR